METKAKRLLLVVITFAVSLVGAVLRHLMLKYSMDENRLLLDGLSRGYLYGLLALAAVALAAALVLCLSLRKLPALRANLSSKPVWKILMGVVGVFIAVESLMRMKGISDNKLTTLACIFGILGGLALLALAAVQMLDHRGSFLFLLPLCIWAALQLVCNYKLWSKDPILIDYCFEMLSDITGMLALFHIGGFFFDYGKRRLSVFWCAACTLFSAISLPDCLGEAEFFLHRLSLVLLMGCFLLQLVFCSGLEKEEA